MRGSLPPGGERGGIMRLKVRPVAAVHPHEVLYDPLEIELALLGEDGGLSEMLDVGAPGAERNETVEMLYIKHVVVSPLFLEVQRIGRASDAAHLTGLRQDPTL
jgi:hypothetical protein